MRILVITNLYPPAAYGGYEALCAATTERLAADHDVMVLTTSHRGLPSDDKVVRELAFLPPSRLSSVRAPLASLRAVKLTRRMLEGFRPELIFVWNGAALPQAALRVAELSGVPVAWSIHEHWFSRLYSVDRFTRYLVPGAQAVRAAWGVASRALNRLPSLGLEFERRELAGVSWVSESLRASTPPPPTVEPAVERVIPSAVVDHELWLGLERRPDIDPPLIAFVGRLEYEKGPDIAYRALAALRDRHGIEARMVLAGHQHPTMRATLDRLGPELGIERLVRRVGPLDPAGVGQLFQQASALLMPVTWQEPAGLVPIEAALARLPVVASRSGGMPERLLPEEHAIYFEIGDAEAAADALASVLRDPGRTAERVARASERARDFTFDGYMARTLEFLEATIEGYKRGMPGSPVWVSPS
jgi:glycosyltransferase involved in cell wall biosynthesis